MSVCEPPREWEREWDEYDVSDMDMDIRRKSVADMFGCDEREFREVVEDEAVEFSCVRLCDGFAVLADRGKGAGDGGRRSTWLCLCSKLMVGIYG